MKKYNLDKLVKVECHDCYLSDWYTYRKEIRIFGIRIRKSGVYDFFDIFCGQSIPQNHFLEGGKIYEKPEVILNFHGGHSKRYYFDSLSEADSFANEITGNGKWIK